MDRDRAASVFGLVSDATRVDVLRAVAEAQHDRGEAGAGPVELTFSEIYDRVDVENTSKLSYHLGELAGTFLRKGEDGYSFTHAGERTVRFLLSENYERLPEFGPRETDGTCPFCAASALAARLHHQYFFVECTACERPVAGYTLTPAQARSHDGDDLVRAVKRAQAMDYARARRGICPACSGALDTEIRELPADRLPGSDSFLVVDGCESCLRQYNAPLTYAVAYHPASVAFHWERGVDVTGKGLWEFHEHLHADRWSSERVGTDPDEYAVTLRRDGDELRCRVAADGTVTHTERVRRD